MLKTIYFNGRVYTGELPLEEAFLVEDGKFLEAGKNEVILSRTADEKVDLNGRFVCAGLNDSHMHMLS